MATKKPKAEKVFNDPELYPEINPECLKAVYDLYAKYSGYQIAQCIRHYRARQDENPDSND